MIEHVQLIQTLPTMATVQLANFIQYGRRMGKTKSMAHSDLPPTEEETHSGKQINANLSQVTVLPRREWERIQNNLNAQQKELERKRRLHQEREDLHKESQDVVKHWSNTIVGQRQKKLEARKIREEKEEKERVKIDIEEAKIQAKKRQEAIEKAKTRQYFQTDRVKSFHGALLLTEVLQERDAQLELKKQKIANEKGKDLEMLKYQREQHENGIRQDQAKAAERYRLRKKVAEYQQMQIGERKGHEVAAKLDDKREGEEVKKLVKLHEWEQQKLDEVRKGEKKKLMESYAEHISNRDAIRALDAQQQEEEDDEIRIFANAKKKMLKLRKEKEIDLFNHQQEHRDRMVSLLAGQLKQKVNDEDARIVEAERLKDEKLAKEKKDKEDKLNRDLASIAAHRKHQMDLKEQLAREDHQNNLELLDVKMEADRIFAEKQTEWRRGRKEKLQNLQHFHASQINERAEKERYHREESLANDLKIIEQLDIEEKQFQDYASGVIAAAKERNCNTYPLVKAAQSGTGGGRGPNFVGKGGIRPSYPTSDGTGVQLPKYQRGSTESIKSQYQTKNPKVAKKRLGFVW